MGIQQKIYIKGQSETFHAHDVESWAVLQNGFYSMVINFSVHVLLLLRK